MADNNPKVNLANLPDWLKVLVLAMAVFGAGGGGAQLLGRDYGPQFEKLDKRLESIETRTGEDHDDLVRLQTRVDALERRSP